MKHIFVIGVGLIGGSIALDLKRLNPEVTVYGMDNNPAHLAEAISLKIIDKKAEFADLKHADLVILSIPYQIIHRQQHWKQLLHLGLLFS